MSDAGPRSEGQGKKEEVVISENVQDLSKDKEEADESVEGMDTGLESASNTHPQVIRSEGATGTENKVLYSEILGQGENRNWENSAYLDPRRRNVVRLHYTGSIVPDRESVGRDLLIDSLHLSPIHVYAFIHFNGSRDYDISFWNPAFLDLFWERFEQVKDAPIWQNFEIIKVSQNTVRQVTILFRTELVSPPDIRFWLRRYCSILGALNPIQDSNGFWNGGYKVKVQLKSKDNKIEHLPNTIVIGRDRGYLFYPGQPRTCRRCGSTKHFSTNCAVQVCNKCGKQGHITKDCPNIIVCNLCNIQGHTYAKCPMATKNLSLPFQVVLDPIPDPVVNAFPNVIPSLGEEPVVKQSTGASELPKPAFEQQEVTNKIPDPTLERDAEGFLIPAPVLHEPSTSGTAKCGIEAASSLTSSLEEISSVGEDAAASESNVTTPGDAMASDEAMVSSDVNEAENGSSAEDALLPVGEGKGKGRRYRGRSEVADWAQETELSTVGSDRVLRSKKSLQEECTWDTVRRKKKKKRPDRAGKMDTGGGTSPVVCSMAAAGVCGITRCFLSGASNSDRNDAVLLPTIQMLMKGYNKYLRPNFDGEPVKVGMSLDIASIDAVSEINMDYTATIFLRQRWIDERLLFEGNKSLSLDGRLVELLWVPDTFIVDSKKSFLHDITVENRLIRIFANGTVLYAIRITATIACNMDLTKYPMDRQVCTLQLESWGYNIQDVMFYWTRGNDSVRGLETLQLAQYTVENHYTSISQAVYETGFYPKLVLHFELRRNILYFILETYVPSTLLVILSWVSFWISQSSVPARTCIGVTTVLTMTTLMMGARTSLPNANCFIKAIDVYLGICFSFIFGALLEYAIAHFCTVHHYTIEDVHRDLKKELEESNGCITAISRNSTPIIKRGKHLPRTNSSSENNGRNDLALDNSKILVLFKNKAHRIAGCFTVENPDNIDRYSRLVFPLAFVVINFFYWIYYLFL
nr:PREDICTED: gamma-aminobutyric acid receptor subunit pi [Latimeria chalumnae]|eukprot:XP_006002506.1 PREDICTED: gamma-aminobutyric acid receptor subunit pi [Latimeria chalumnae]